MSIAMKALASVAIAGAVAFASVVADAHGADRSADHGAAVSAVAQSNDTTGKAHGAAVSAVARSDAGKGDTSSNTGMSAIANTLGATISALAQATTGADKGATISAAAKTHGTTVSTAARAR